MVASTVFGATLRRRARGDQRGRADPRIGAARVGANHDAFALVLDSGKFASGAIRLKIDGRFRQYSAHDFMGRGIELHFLAGGQGYDIALLPVDDGRQEGSWKKQHQAVH